MRRVHILVEGQTEETVLNHVVKPCLMARDVSVTSSILATKRPASGGKYRGGVSSWAKILRDVELLLGDSSLDVLTTMIDYYGVPADSPGIQDRPAAGPYERIAHVQAAMAEAVGASRFRPHLMLHETEAWVLAAGYSAAQHFGRPEVGSKIAGIVAAAGGPELVDDGPTDSALEAAAPAVPHVREGGRRTGDHRGSRHRDSPRTLPARSGLGGVTGGLTGGAASSGGRAAGGG